MATPKERREQRKAEKQEKWAADRQKTLDQLALSRSATSTAQIPPKQPRLAPHLEREAAKNPKIQDGFDRHSQQMSWCHTRSDVDGYWEWGEARAWTDEEWGQTIQPSLDQLKNSTWEEIEQMSSVGKGQKRLRSHHWHEIREVATEAQLRWVALGLEEFDNLFRFRIGGQRRRAWGFVVQAHFHLVWWDRVHMIFPVDKD